MKQQIFDQQCIDKIGVMLLGLDNQGRITIINKAGSKLLGYSAEELIGVDWCDRFILQAEKPAQRQRFFRIIAGEEEQPDYHENIILTGNDEQRVIAWHNTLLRDNDGTVSGLLCTGEDITDHKDLEKRIKNGELRFGSFIEYISDALFIYDINGSYIEVNEYACSSLGYTREELLTLMVSDIDLDFTKVDGAAVQQRTYRHKDGHIIPVEVKITPMPGKGKPLFIAVARDISKRLQQRRLTDNRDLLRVIIDSIPDIICIKNGDGKWLLANSFDLHLFGLEDVDYRGKTDLELAEYTPFYAQAFTTCEQSDERAWAAESPIRSIEIIQIAYGAPRFFDVYKIPLFHNDGRRKVLVVVGRDITEQKRVEEQYRRLFEQSPNPYVFSLPSGKIRAVNHAFSRQFGYSSEDVIDKKLEDFLTPDSRRSLIQYHRKLLQGTTFPKENYEIIRADGAIAQIEVTASIIYNESNQAIAIQSVLLDVTKQRLIEERILASEKRYRQLFERAPAGIVYFNINFQVTDCNDEYLKIMQTDRDRLIGFDIRKIRHTQILSLIEQALQGNDGKWEGTYTTIFSRKTLYITMMAAPLYDGKGNIEGGMVIVVDRSRQRQAEEEKYRLMSAIDQASEAIVITDTDANIEYVNPSFEVLTGYSAEEVQGKNLQVLQSGLHVTEFSQEMWQTLRAGRIWKGHIINKKKDGTLIEEDVTISPVRNHEGKISNYVAVQRDVTEEVSLKKQLDHALKMEAIGTLAGGIAHDFNNILAAVLGYAEMAELQLAEDDPARKDIAQIITAGQRATDLIRQILTFSRQKEEELRPVKIQFVLKEALKLLRSSLPSSIDLQQNIDMNCSAVLADPIRIHQILMNLCTNARQAMESGQGILKVSLAEIGTSPLAQPENSHQGRWLDIEISDSGIGMEPQVKERIFDPFFTTKKNGQGTGLGLSVVHGIVKSHGGEITVESESGGGTTFHVFLPVIGDEAQEERENKQKTLPHGTERILVVDDEPLLVELMERCLEILGYEVKGFVDSREAISWFTGNADQIDLVITDMTMPHLTGDELAVKMLAQRPDIRIILCTGYSDIMDANKAKRMGIRKFLNKPVDNRVLAQSVREVLENSA